MERIGWDGSALAVSGTGTAHATVTQRAKWKQATAAVGGLACTCGKEGVVAAASTRERREPQRRLGPAQHGKQRARAKIAQLSGVVGAVTARRCKAEPCTARQSAAAWYQRRSGRGSAEWQQLRHARILKLNKNG
jgi:hypothetical protein